MVHVMSDFLSFPLALKGLLEFIWTGSFIELFLFLVPFLEFCTLEMIPATSAVF